MEKFAQYYFLIYWFISLLLTFRAYNRIRKLNNDSVISEKDNYIPIVGFIIFYVLFFGFRPNSIYFGDTVMYTKSYETLQSFGVFNNEGAEDPSKDWLFYVFMRFCSYIMNVSLFFVFIIYFYIVMMYKGCKKIDRRHGALLMLFCIGAFSFYSYSVNGIRNGVACSFVILALALLCNGDKKWTLILSIIAVGCHKSAALPVVCMLFVYFVRKPKLMFIVWFCAIVVSLVVGDSLSNMISLFGFDERLAANLQSGDDIANSWGVEMENRFRWDFLIYSSMPVLLGWYVIFRRKIYNNTYLLLLGTYMYANAFWVVFIRTLFSNRFAYLSWFIYPIVLAYPLLNFPVFKNSHSKKTALILLAQFVLTTVLLIGYF